MERTAHIIATVTRLPGPEELALLPRGVGWLEVRADRVHRGEEPPEEELRALRERFDGGFVYTLRSRTEGGDGPSEPAARAAALERAGSRPDLWELVDLEADRDLVPSVLESVPPDRRILSWHGPVSGREALKTRFDAMARTPARYYKLVPAAVQPGEELAPLLLLADLRERAGQPRDEVIAFASGPSGVWTRLVAPRLGAPVVFGSFPGDEPGAPGQPAVDRLVVDYGLPELPAAASLFGIVGRPVDHSLSPRLHNRAYRELGIGALYVPFHAEHFGDFWWEVVESGALDRLGLPLRGLSVTAPYKEAALAVAGASSPRTAAVGGANTLVLSAAGEGGGQVWEAESTDPEGVVLPLRALGVELEGATAAVVGAGGAGRSAVVGLLAAGAEVTLVNRSHERGTKAATSLGVQFQPLDAFATSDPARYRVVVHATSLGRAADDPLPFDPRVLAPDAVVLDLVYTDVATPLLAAVQRSGRVPVDGREVLLAQALEQFRMMTGQELPIDLAHRALGITRRAAVAPPVPPGGSAPDRGER